MCGVCDGDSSSCMGVADGTAVLDEYQVCDGDKCNWLAARLTIETHCIMCNGMCAHASVCDTLVGERKLGQD